MEKVNLLELLLKWKMTEFDLSKKIVHEEAIKTFIDIRSDKWIKMEDVKEFIKQGDRRRR